MIDNTETNNTDTLGKRIMALRKAAGMTQEQVAERLGVSPQAVSKWENDVSCPDVTMIPRIAQPYLTYPQTSFSASRQAPSGRPILLHTAMETAAAANPPPQLRA
ncbi:MAG: helix-turn-helix domain-containing protein [Christensenellales bacterium]